MNISILLISLYIFFDTLGYGIYEYKNQNKFGGSIVIILDLFMVIFVIISTFRFH